MKAGALQNAIFKSANFSSIATNAKGVIQIFNVGAERMLGYLATDLMNKIGATSVIRHRTRRRGCARLSWPHTWPYLPERSESRLSPQWKAQR